MILSTHAGGHTKTEIELGQLSVYNRNFHTGERLFKGRILRFAKRKQHNASNFDTGHYLVQYKQRGQY